MVKKVSKAAITLAKIGAPTDEIRTALRDAGRGRDPRLRKAAAVDLELLQKKGPVYRPSRLAGKRALGGLRGFQGSKPEPPLKVGLRA